MKIIDVRVLPPQGGTHRVQPILPTLEVLQELVGGDIEEIHTYFGVMIVNADGLRLELPHNFRASSLVERFIVGTVVIAGAVDRNGNLTDYRGPSNL